VDCVKTTTGGVTDYLRNHWGLTDKFKNITAIRYENAKPDLAEFEYEKYSKEYQLRKKIAEKEKYSFDEICIDKESFIDDYNVNLITKEFDKDKNKLIFKIKDWSKRIDHRHQALDALIVACTESAHVKKLNNLNKELQTELKKASKTVFGDTYVEDENLIEEFMQLSKEVRDAFFQSRESFRRIEMPWKGFVEETEKHLSQIIISQKSKEKLIIEPQTGSKELGLKIRGPLHNATLYGKTEGKECSRIPLTKLAGNNFATDKTIEKIVHPFLKLIIKNHFENTYKKDKKEAFSAEGILELNKTLKNRTKTNKKGLIVSAPHPPIDSIKIFYQDPSKKKTDEDTLQRLDRKKSYNSKLYVETGGNYCFAIFEKEGKRVYDIISFFDAANLIKLKLNETLDKNSIKIEHVIKQYFEEKNKVKVLFLLKQGDYVYIPQLDELNQVNQTDFWGDKKARFSNVHVVVKFSGDVIYFIRHDIAKPIENKIEFGTQNCYTQINKKQLKETCIKIQISRLGNISKA